jgi:3-isopropylmalate/(R)-2-methylmalate dehydratase large subunit
MLHLIGLHGADGGSGHAVEFTGSAVRDMDVEERLTLCNMAVEFSAFTGLVAPDERTIEWCRDRPYGPTPAQQAAAERHWRGLASDPDAVFDRVIEVDAGRIRPSVTWGTSPQHTVPLDGHVPDPARAGHPDEARAMERALAYMGLAPGTIMTDVTIDAAFIGSCTNARLSDLRQAATWLRGRTVAPGVRAVVVPGSSTVKREAESEGLDRIFMDAGFEWRESGCSMCFYAGGETFGPGARVVSSTNRNFEGRQGPGTRTHLASPLTVVASACAGRLAAAEWPAAKSA